MPLSTCVAGAPIERVMPATPTTEKGDVTGVPSSVSFSPGTLAASVSVAFTGTTSRKVEVVNPLESRTVSVMR